MQNQRNSSEKSVHQNRQEIDRTNEEAFEEVFRVLNDRYLNDAIISKYREEASRTNVECYNQVDLVDEIDFFDQESLADEQDQHEAMTRTRSGSASALEKGEQQGSVTSDEDWGLLSSEDDVPIGTEAEIKGRREGKEKRTPAKISSDYLVMYKQLAKYAQIDVQAQLDIEKKRKKKRVPGAHSTLAYFFHKHFRTFAERSPPGLKHYQIFMRVIKAYRRLGPTQRRLLQKRVKELREYTTDPSTLSTWHSSWNQFLMEESQKLKAQGVRIYDRRDLIEQCSKKWKEISAEERKMYKQRAYARVVTRIRRAHEGKFMSLRPVKSHNRLTGLQYRGILVKRKVPPKKTPKSDDDNRT